MPDKRSRSLVVVQLSGGNDYLNTVVPFNEPLYYDFRPSVHIKPENVLQIDSTIGFSPGMEPIKSMWDRGEVAVINAIGYPNPNRSHFRSMDIWHTALPERIGDEGWLGRTIFEMDPNSANVLTGVSFGRGLPRAMGKKGVPVASVGNLETYGLYPDIEDQKLREYAMRAFSKMYGGQMGRDPVMDFLGQTGKDALKGAAMLQESHRQYKSNIEYADTQISQDLKNVAQVLFADFGTRIFYTQLGSFDTHAAELDIHKKLWGELSEAINDFHDDLIEHGRQSDVVILVFSEFGRRIRDNGSGTDHGSGGVAFMIGDSVNGGMYGEYPSLKVKDQLEGDLHFNNDFRMTYSTVLEQWLGLDASDILNGHFEQFDMLNKDLVL